MPAYLFLRLLVEIFRFIPFRVLYGISDGLAFLLHRVAGYRKKVIFGNLKRAFPEKTPAELKEIARGFYRNLTDVSLETIKSFTTPIPEISRRAKVLNPELIAAELSAGKSVLLAGSHAGNWEYPPLSLPQLLNYPVIGAYKKLSNQIVDRYTRQLRARGGTQPFQMEEFLGEVRKNRHIPTVYMLISDQSPGTRKRAHWAPFFHTETAFLPGLDVIARTFGFPVYKYELHRVKRGFYEIEFSPLWPEPAQAKEADITLEYARQLELEIRKAPETWLWSHKRWKMKRES